jgi:hypothetical protein
MSWQERLLQEWAVAQDDATREHLMAIYQEKLTGLPNHELEKLLAQLADLRCGPAHGSADSLSPARDKDG